MNIQTVCILGGTGFVGRWLSSHLVEQGYKVRVLTRHWQRHRDLLVLPGLRLMETDVYDPAQLAAQFNGCQSVINLIGILNEKGRNGHGFRQVHADLPEKVAQICLDTGIKRLLHMSALNADANQGASYYLRSKGEGENRVLALARQGLEVTIFQPSVIFGPGDSFFNRFGSLLKLSPFIFPLACPEARLTPVYVGDVARAFARALSDKEDFSQSYELCGPKIYTLKQLVEYTAKVLELKRRVIGLSDKLSRIQASIFEYVPGKPFSKDNYASLQVPSICHRNGLHELGIEPTAIDAIVPGYLGQVSQRSQYLELRRHAQR
ncbi:complex I NDUFA9 subunit family protein [Nitrosococcus oceani]|uniref:NAD-dependent epimerase/dehydratase n=2 Tax=Nitrosococcus oceani TaxID=1229 RepID=Q3JE30_NITOC|nr:complex I NDUFA9 subunit family protein [Nitrosococcus oceani]ABA56916.1 NAD-dependent epimerase/dehydratase [Nitrosococcus oceani ATCC 19707]KFI20636.1 epimerase [Nitrosococcus oceani C-27]KFI23719.1 epimerase [Nitrosococcus oceani]GEM20826.1 epimerase [Nitrosococcus oceani]